MKNKKSLNLFEQNKSKLDKKQAEKSKVAVLVVVVACIQVAAEVLQPMTMLLRMQILVLVPLTQDMQFNKSRAVDVFHGFFQTKTINK